ncbi:MAG: hydrogenase maturation nickel metallochaperone HypA [Candidatus Thermoplasmatota archaeon]|nr:hydrogenase maturation nickel metallochaperone HypA [Candidatus Thermoplasmatota archaeon]
MHEFSVVQDVVRSVLAQVKKHPGVVRVEEVALEVGELTFLGHEQLRYGFQVLGDLEPLIRGAVLDIQEKKAAVQCSACGYKGALDYVEDPSHHISMPIFSCPKCKDVVEILEGKECTITNIRVLLDDEEEG